MVTDPLADMLTRIRNGCMARLNKIDVHASKLKLNVAKILKLNGYIKNYKLMKEESKTVIRIYLKYTDSNQSAIVGLKQHSKPSRRIYVKQKDIPSVLNGMGIAIISTSRGVFTDSEARRENIGGELLCSVW
ncbi:MAG: 30S ribosomal protein S8 [Pseudomonadota bacterium]